MSYKFKVSETFSQGFLRIGTEQITRAVQDLDSPQDVHKSVHEARKTCKRLRALLSLYADVLDDDERRDLDRRFRDFGRSLAGMRDIQALLDSIAHVERRFGGMESFGGLAKLRVTLEERRQEALATPPQAAAQRQSEFKDDLQAAAKLLRSVRISHDDFQAIQGGLERTYRASRRLGERAYEEDTNESFHEWRKQLQRHWRHMQLMTPVWPTALRARAQKTRAICEVIGQDHDLAALEQELGRRRKRGRVADTLECRAQCRQLQQELRASIRDEGERLFLEGAGAFSARLSRYWDHACRQRKLAKETEEATVD